VRALPCKVLLCSRCDRGQRYCGPACSRAARQDSQREAARRYQAGRAGRMAHAERARRWRQRRRERERERPCHSVAALDTAATNIVTHQGSPIPALGAPLAAPEQAHVRAPSVSDATPIAWRCRRCAAALSPWTRQGFLRHARASRWPARLIDPCP
jgi:hypothetical protein